MSRKYAVLILVYTYFKDDKRNAENGNLLKLKVHFLLWYINIKL